MGRNRLNKTNPILYVCLILLCFSVACSDDGPTGATTSNDPTGQGQIDPSGQTDFYIGTAPIDGIPDGRIDVWAHNLTVDSDNVVSFDVVLINRSPQPVHPPVLFFITRIVPDDVHVLNSDIVYIRGGPPGFDFSDDLGADNKLDPDESSDPVTMKFGMSELTSFSIGFRIDVGSAPGDAVISGVVFDDGNHNGERDSSEPGLAGVRVSLSGTREILRVVETDGGGRYGFRDISGGIYEIGAMGQSNWLATTENPMIVTVLEDSGGVALPVENVNFGFFRPDPRPIDPVFGPVPVGPASIHGEEFKGEFWIRSTDRDVEHILFVTPPNILSPLLMRVDVAKVWINEQLVYEFNCDNSLPECLPSARVPIPPRVLNGGTNHIGILVRGNEHTLLLFSIARRDSAGGY